MGTANLSASSSDTAWPYPDDSSPPISIRAVELQTDELKRWLGSLRQRVARVAAVMPVAIVSDTCHYLPRELVEANGIHEVSLYVHWQGETQRESEITDYDEYYERLGRATDLPTTSQPSIGDFLAVYEPLLH